MSLEHATKFLEEARGRKEVRAEVDKAAEHFVEIGKKHGHQFTREELHKALLQRWGVKEKPSGDDPDICFSEPLITR